MGVPSENTPTYWRETVANGASCVLVALVGTARIAEAAGFLVSYFWKVGIYDARLALIPEFPSRAVQQFWFSTVPMVGILFDLLVLVWAARLLRKASASLKHSSLRRTEKAFS